MPSFLSRTVSLNLYKLFCVKISPLPQVWEKASAAIEIAQGKAMADAAVAAGAELFIWSSLPNVTAMTHGKLTQVAHFDSKAEVETYVRGLPIKSVFYMAAFYMQNFLTMFKPRMVCLPISVFALLFMLTAAECRWCS